MNGIHEWVWIDVPLIMLVAVSHICVNKKLTKK